MERCSLRQCLIPARLACAGLGLIAASGFVTSPLAAADPARGSPPAETPAHGGQSDSINLALVKALAALSAGKWQEAATTLKQLIAANPDACPWEFYQALGAAQTGLREYPDAIQSFEKGVAIARSHPGPQADAARVTAGIAQMLTAEGNLYLRTGKTDEAVARYNQAAAFSPDPATAYFNVCATLYNSGNMSAAAVAADRAIAADPKKADAYFIKGSALFAGGKSEGGRYVAPPESVAALKKYLELAPTGPHADEVKSMLAVTEVAPGAPGGAAPK
jgi:tetratricopeptide (TPR) repeat protein